MLWCLAFQVSVSLTACPTKHPDSFGGFAGKPFVNRPQNIGRYIQLPPPGSLNLTDKALSH